MKHWKKYLSIIGLIIFIYILIKIDLKKVFNEIIQADLYFLSLSLLVLIIFLLTQTYKWFYIAKKQKINVPYIEAVKINIISNFYGFITPSKIGNMIRAEYLKKYSKSFGKGLSNFILDKVLDLCSIFFIGILFLFIFNKKFIGFPTHYLLIILLFLIACLLIFINKKRAKVFLKIFYDKILPKKLKEKARNAFHSFYEDMPKKRNFIIFFILNLINWIIYFRIIYLIGLSLEINLSFIYFLAILPIATIVALLPISLNGLGTREATLIALFGLFNISAEKVFSMSIISLFIIGIIPSIIANFLSLKNKR